MAERSDKSHRTAIAVIGTAAASLCALIWIWLSGPAPRLDAPDPAATPLQHAPAQPPRGPTSRATPTPSAALPAEPPPSDALEIPLTGLPLRLVTLSARAERAHSFAQIEDLQHGHAQTLVEGRVLRDRPHVSLVRIDREGVVLDNYGVAERLLLDPSGQRLLEEADQGGERPVFELSDEERRQRRELGERLRALTEGGARPRPAAEVGGLLTEAEIEPLYGEEGELVGVRLSEIQPGGVFEAAGLQSGDVVTSVNGVVPWNEPAAVSQLAADLITSDRVEVGIERSDGTDVVVQLSTEELLRAAGELLESGEGPEAIPEHLLPVQPPRDPPEPPAPSK